MSQAYSLRRVRLSCAGRRVSSSSGPAVGYGLDGSRSGGRLRARPTPRRLGLCREIRSFLRTFAPTSVGCSRSAAQVATSRGPSATGIGRGRRSRLLEEPCGRLSTRCEALVTASLLDKVRLELDEAFFVRQPRLLRIRFRGRRKIRARERCRFESQGGRWEDDDGCLPRGGCRGEGTRSGGARGRRPPGFLG